MLLWEILKVKIREASIGFSQINSATARNEINDIEKRLREAQSAEYKDEHLISQLEFHKGLF